MKKLFTNKFLLYFLGVALFFLLWWVISLIIHEPVLIFPDPLSTLKETIKLLGMRSTYISIGASFLKMIIGFIIAFFFAAIFGTLSGNHIVIHNLLKPTISIIKSVPTAALVFILLVVVNAKYTPVIIVVVVAFPILYESFVKGIKNIDVNVTESLRLESSSIIRNTFQIKLPLSIPYILVGVASSFALSLKIEIMAEIISGNTSYGIGAAIKAARVNDPTNMVPIFAYCFIAIAIILVIDIIKEIVKKIVRSK